MAAPTNTYCDYAAGNDYKGATFTDGAYTSATKTLVKAGAFAATKVNHWLYLESNDGGSIVAGYYKVATATDANTVILATDAGAGVDDDAAKCTQHDGGTSKPWRSVQGALDLITRDATNGNQINVKTGTAQVNQAALTLTTYGTPTKKVPLILRGYTSAANDGGIGEIDCNGAAMWAATNYQAIFMAYLEIHNFGNNIGIKTSAYDQYSMLYRCEVHKGASSPSGKALIEGLLCVECYIHDAGTTGTGIIVFSSHCYGNYIYNCPTGISVNTIGAAIVGNLIVDCTDGINCVIGYMIVAGNTIYHSGASTGSGIKLTTYDVTGFTVVNNVIAGYSGSGGKGINASYEQAIWGYNLFYNNATNESLGGDLFFDAGGDVTPGSSPFVDAAGGNYALVAGLANGFPSAYWQLATTENKIDIGAVQLGAGAGGGVIRRVMRLLGG